MKKTHLLHSIFWCLVLGLAFATYAQDKTKLDGNILSVSPHQNNAQSQFNVLDATILRWDDGVNFNSIGLTAGGTFEVSARFDASITGPLAGQGLTQIEIYIALYTGSIVFKIYDEGTPTTPGALLYSEDVTSQIITDSWNLITLATPVPISGNDIWIGYEVTHLAGQFPAGTDAGPAVIDGDWIYLAPGPWQRLSLLGLNYNWNIAGYVEPIGPPCPVGVPSNPNPPDGATGIPITGNTATWTNGAGTTQIELWFGPQGSLAQVYTGTPITSYALPILQYLTTYGWRVVDKNDTCSTSGPTWTFTTMQDPNLNCVFIDDFEGGLSAWTITNLGGTCVWTQYFPPYPNSYTMPPTSSGGVLSADVDECGSGTTENTAAQIGPFDATIYQQGYVKFDQDFNAIDAQDECYVEVSTDGGTSWNIIWSQIGVDLVGTTEVADMSAYSNQQATVWVRFRSVQPGWDWWWTIDNVEVCLFDAIPVELTSFTANASEGLVELSWITATETNNQGFEVQRSSGSEFETIAFVEGHGTTTESQAYSYADKNVNATSYSYRLKQVDFDGTFEYSSVVEVDVPAPAVFALEQNYPNPFNPSTKIAFKLAVDSKVSLKVFDILGQEVASLVNTNLVAGSHQVNFDASSLNSGVYMYRIEATGIDGTNFVDVKKMILTK